MTANRTQSVNLGDNQDELVTITAAAQLTSGATFTPRLDCANSAGQAAVYDATMLVWAVKN